MTPLPARACVRRTDSPLVWQTWAWCSCLGLYTVTLNAVPLLMGKGFDYAFAATGLGLVGAGQVGGRLLFAAIPSRARIPVITGTAASAILLLAILPGPPGLLMAAAILAVRSEAARPCCRPPLWPNGGA